MRENIIFSENGYPNCQMHLPWEGDVELPCGQVDAGARHSLRLVSKSRVGWYGRTTTDKQWPH